MKTLSLTQPWASLVALGEKKWETRSFRVHYRGPLAIHASKAFPGWARLLCEQDEFRHALHVHGYEAPEQWCSMVVCVTSVEDCVPAAEIRKHLSEKERLFGNYTDGRWAWKLGPVVERFAHEQYVVRGWQGLWNWERNGTDGRNSKMGT